MTSKLLSALNSRFCEHLDLGVWFRVVSRDYICQKAKSTSTGFHFQHLLKCCIEKVFTPQMHGISRIYSLRSQTLTRKGESGESATLPIY